MNLTIQTPDEKLASIRKPALEAVRQFTLTPHDWLVACAGFEDRALGVLRNAISGSESFNVLLINYLPFFKENRAQTAHEICDKTRGKVVDVTYDRREPAGFGRTIIEQLSACQGRIFIDISAMSRLLIVQILVALGTRADRFNNCFVAYAEAEWYPPTEPEAKAQLQKSETDPTFSILFLSSGVFDVTLVPELSSLAPAGAQTRLIAFPSLDAHLLIALRAEIQPSRFSFIEGVPPDPKNQWRTQLIAAINRLDQIRDAERVQTSTLHYSETLDCLLDLYSKHSVRERLLVSPTGSKMQTVAVGIFRSFLEDVQIVYPTPHGFCRPDGYTHGVGALYLLALSPFSIPIPDAP